MVISFLLVMGFGAAPECPAARGEACLKQLQTVLPPSKPWETWRDAAGELPPDFDTMPSMAPLPPPLETVVDGKPTSITTPEAWEPRRREILELFHRWILGTVPPAPDNLQATVLSEREEGGTTVRAVELRFGPDRKAKLTLELLVPKGSGPFPVFMTQTNHRQWALIALRRGYLACVYAAADIRDDTDSFVDAFPGYDWSRLTRRAWAASRCIDYLATVPQARMDQIAITGHSRNGKQSLIASALDPRIAAVISSSSGTGGSMPTRYAGEPQFGEGIENITRTFPDWFHPRWRFFVGREQKLPVDFHELIALSAPRACLLSIALNDSVESSWAMEKVYLAAKPVYGIYRAEDKLRILWRAGSHETWTATIERYLDWCDTQFGRARYDFPERLIHPWDWTAWSQHSGHVVDTSAYPVRTFGIAHKAIASRAAWEARGKSLANDVAEMMGAPLPAACSPVSDYGKEPDHIKGLLAHSDTGPKLELQNVVFGDYINADLYLPKGAKESGKKLPAVLWLHPFSFAKGYAPSYRRGDQCFKTFANAGYATFCYDQIGHGRRIEEVEGFYTRYPDASLLQQMVQDARAALDALGELPYVDSSQVYVVGYGLGALVALHLAPLDSRPAGYGLVTPPSPFRLDTNEVETGGIARWSRLQMLLPRLGFFVGQEARVPYDVEELLAAMAPRPVLVVSPRYDRENPLPLTEKAVNEARKVFRLYKAEDSLRQEIPEAYNHFDPSIQRYVVDWLNRLTADERGQGSGVADAANAKR